jgi:hypothetical protein
LKILFCKRNSKTECNIAKFVACYSTILCDDDDDDDDDDNNNNNNSNNNSELFYSCYGTTNMLERFIVVVV